VNHEKHRSCTSAAYGLQAALARNGTAMLSQFQRVLEHFDCVFKRNAMFKQIARVLLVVPLEFRAPYIVTTNL
jgi:hypothetical protein